MGKSRILRGTCTSTSNSLLINDITQIIHDSVMAILAYFLETSSVVEQEHNRRCHSR